MENKSKPLTLAETGDAKLTARGYNLGLKIVPNLLHAMTEKDLEYWEGHLDELKEGLAKGLSLPKEVKFITLLGGKQAAKTGDFEKVWKKFYKKVLGLDLEMPASYPEHKEGFDFLLIVQKGLTHKMITLAEEKLYPCYRYRDQLDEETKGRNEREPQASYGIRIRDRIEADEELKNLSANQTKEKGLKTMTLLERRVLELFYFWLTGKHLDIDNVTLCSGSRYSDGYVPYAGWRQRCAKFDVRWCYSDGSGSPLRAREVVSL